MKLMEHSLDLEKISLAHSNAMSEKVLDHAAKLKENSLTNKAK